MRGAVAVKKLPPWARPSLVDLLLPFTTGGSIWALTMLGVMAAVCCWRVIDIFFSSDAMLNLQFFSRVLQSPLFFDAEDHTGYGAVARYVQFQGIVGRGQQDTFAQRGCFVETGGS